MKSIVEMQFQVTSMLVTVVGDEMCWRQLEDVGDDFGHFS